MLGSMVLCTFGNGLGCSDVVAVGEIWSIKSERCRLIVQENAHTINNVCIFHFFFDDIG